MTIKNLTRRGRLPDEQGAEGTIERILASARSVLIADGSTSMKVATVCKMTGISRGTFYRYFESKEDVLEALVTFERQRLDSLIDEKVKGCNTPREMTIAYIGVFDQFLDMNARRFFRVEPQFFIEYNTKFFPYSVKRAMKTLAPAFDIWDKQYGAKLDRRLIAELLIRFILSEVMVPSKIHASKFVDRIEKNLMLMTNEPRKT